MNKLIVHLEFLEEEIVYLKTDLDNYPHIITGWSYRKGVIIYYASSNGSEKCVYDYELSREKNVIY